MSGINSIPEIPTKKSLASIFDLNIEFLFIENERVKGILMKKFFCPSAKLQV